MKNITAIRYETKELNGDIYTPISLFQSLTGTKKFLLESSLKHEQSGRYSFIGSDPFLECRAYGDRIVLEDLQDGEKTERRGKPLEVLEELFPKENDFVPNLPFTGGAIGFIGYDVICQYEEIGVENEDQLAMPDIDLLFYEKVIVFDHLEQKVTLIAVDPWTKAQNNSQNLGHVLDEMETAIQKNLVHLEEEQVEKLQFQSQTTKQAFMSKVEKAKRYIEEGDIFQVVLSQRLIADFKGKPFSFYRELRKSNPSPYMFYIDFEDYIVLGTSPESLVKVEGRTVTTNPIAGTRKRGMTVEEDVALEKELLSDEKEIAEHRMLVDLGRNDLGRVSEIGSIYLSKYMLIEKYKHVMHIVSEVKGQLKQGKTALDALISCLPAGTVSGAPKIRAMQIINELEEVKRGAYSGAVGYIGINGNLDFALAIRTMILKDEKAYVQAGAGIVHDSVPEQEYEETLNKAKALLEVRK